MSNPEPNIVQLPLVPLRDMVVFPSMMAPFVVGRRASIMALEATLATTEKKIFLATQKDPKIDDPSMTEIYQIGVVATVVQNLKPWSAGPPKLRFTLLAQSTRTTLAPSGVSAQVPSSPPRRPASFASYRTQLNRLFASKYSN